MSVSAAPPPPRVPRCPQRGSCYVIRSEDTAESPVGPSARAEPTAGVCGCCYHPSDGYGLIPICDNSGAMAWSDEQYHLITVRHVGSCAIMLSSGQWTIIYNNFTLVYFHVPIVNDQLCCLANVECYRHLGIDVIIQQSHGENPGVSLIALKLSRLFQIHCTMRPGFRQQ